MKDIQDINLRELIKRETGEKFNAQGYIKCPFHNEKTASLRVKFNSNRNKDFFKCFGCGECGDALDFIIKLKGIDYKEAREYLGMEVKKSEKEELEEKVKKYIEWELSKFRQGQRILGIFPFTNVNGSVEYFKAKFKLADGNKQLSYYHIEGDKIINKRGGEELPYNLFNALQGIKDGKTLVFVEGEKDVNTINSILKDGYVATSIKGCKNINVLLSTGFKLSALVIGDTGEAGEKYKWQVYKLLKDNCREFRFVNLPGLKDLGDNKDVTDWIEAGNDKKDLLNAVNRSLDLKNNYELQQDAGGIYKTFFKDKGDDVLEFKKYITDFKLLEAKRIKFVEEDVEGVKLVLKSPTGEIIEKTGPVTVFDDTKSFKNFLGSLDLSFKGKIEELTDFKGWINKYFALEVEEIHQGVKFLERDNEITFVTDEGAITKEKYYTNVKSNGIKTEMINTEKITTDEFQELRKRLFKFASPEKSLSIIGTIINNLAVYQNEKSKNFLHHLLIVGESGSGKSTILQNVVAPILNYDKKEIKSIGLITPFAFIRDLSEGNYPSLYDEFKPSGLDKYKIAKISEILRNLYDRAAVSRADKFYNTREFLFNRPIILAGEESYPNQETALMERSCIVYLSKKERTEESLQAINWIIKNEHLLNKLGRSLIDVVLRLTIDDYKEIREKVNLNIKGLKNRPLNTALNICTGMEILNLLIKDLGLKCINNYTDHIVANLKKEVLEDRGDTLSVTEQMLCLYNDMIETGRALDSDNVVVYRGDGLYIKTSEMINQIQEHVVRFNSDIKPLRLKDFRSQASRSGYLIGTSNKIIKINKKTVRFDTYDFNLIRELRLTSMVPDDFEEVKDNKVIPFK